MDETKLSKYAAKKLRQAREAAKKPTEVEEVKALPPIVKKIPPDPAKQKKLNARSLRVAQTAVAAELTKQGNAEVWEAAQQNATEAGVSLHNIAIAMAGLLPTTSGAFYGEVISILGMAHSLEERVSAFVRRIECGGVMHESV